MRAADTAVEVAEFVDHGAWVVSPLLICDAIDLPPHPAGVAISSLVILRLAPPAVPRHMVDLDSPARYWVGAIEMNDGPIWQLETKLSDEWDTALLECR